MIRFNHNVTLEEFQQEIDLVKASGFNPIGVSQIYLETAFIFETPQEAINAFEIIELEKAEVVGWWFSKEDFLKEVSEYENKFKNLTVRIYWL